MSEEFKLGSHCFGLARRHFEEKFKDVKPGALQLAMIEIGMEGFRIGFEHKVDLYEALEGMMEIAETAMPDTYFKSDSRVNLAREVLRKSRGES